MIINFIVCSSRYSYITIFRAAKVSMELWWTIRSQYCLQRSRCPHRYKALAKFSTSFLNRTCLECLESIHTINLSKVINRLLHILPCTHYSQVFSSATYSLPISSLKQSWYQHFRQRSKLSPEKLTSIYRIKLIANTD